MEKKLIIPTEVKVCATCSYWDGERRVDEEYSLVVVADDCCGECLAQEKLFDGLNDVRHMPDCAWEPLESQEPAESPGSEPTLAASEKKQVSSAG